MRLVVTMGTAQSFSSPPPDTTDLTAASAESGGSFWTGEIARHNRARLAYAVWSVLSRRLLGDD